MFGVGADSGPSGERPRLPAFVSMRGAWLQILESKYFNFHFDFAEGQNTNISAKYQNTDVFDNYIFKFQFYFSKNHEILRNFHENKEETMAKLLKTSETFEKSERIAKF